MIPTAPRPAVVLAVGVVAAHMLALQALVPEAGTGRLHAGSAPTPVFLIRPEARPADPGTPPSWTPEPRALRSTPEARPLPEPARATAAATGPAPETGDLAAAPARVAPPRQLAYRLSGQTRGLPWSARAELSWQHDGRRYEARLALEDADGGPRSQHSTGSLTASGLAPERYAERTRSEQAVHFRHGDGRITFSANRPEAGLMAGAQDRLSVLMQLGALIAARPQAYPAGTTLSIQTATAREAEVWRFRVEDAEELPLPGGHQATIRLVRAPARDYEPRIEVWLAPSMDYAPVRLRLTQASGDWQDYQWSGADRR